DAVAEACHGGRHSARRSELHEDAHGREARLAAARRRWARERERSEHDQEKPGQPSHRIPFACRCRSRARAVDRALPRDFALSTDKGARELRVGGVSGATEWSWLHPRNRLRVMTRRMMSLVPSQISSSLASRSHFWTGEARTYPAPASVWPAAQVANHAASGAARQAMAAPVPNGSP